VVSFGISSLTKPVIPAKAGIQSGETRFRRFAEWIPAFAGMTAAWNARVSQMTPLPGDAVEKIISSVPEGC